MTDRKGLLPIVDANVDLKVKVALGSNMEGFAEETVQTMAQHNPYLLDFISSQVHLSFDPDISALSALALYRYLDEAAKAEGKALPKVTAEIGALVDEEAGATGLRIVTVERLREDNPVICALIDERAAQSKDAYWETETLSRIYRMLECAADFKGLCLMPLKDDEYN